VRHAGEHNTLYGKTLDEYCGGGSGRYFADTRQRQHHALAVHRPLPELSACMHRAHRCMQQGKYASLFFGQGAEYGNGHDE
jgi:hypothetical protein